MPNILLTGVATLDIINHVDHYPAEDSEVRALDQDIRCGGNAANSALVMQQLGINTCLLAMRADDLPAQQVFDQLSSSGVDVSLCPVQADSTTPTSFISLSRDTGSRSIVHYRKLDELSAEHFTKLELSHFDWFHFEARNCEQLLVMLEHARQYNRPISLELEKPREWIEPLLDYADVLLVSRPYAEHLGFADAESCLRSLASDHPETVITCTWGNEGAWAAERGSLIHQPAFEVTTTVETLGAGDTFNAGLISALAQQQPVDRALALACQLAAHKCQQAGFMNLSFN